MTDADQSAPVALVTGASSGIGEEYARRLAHRGYRVIGVARREQRLEALAQQLAGEGLILRPLVADLSTRAGIEAVARVCEEGALEMMVNNAGEGRYMPFVELPPEGVTELVDLNAHAPVRLARAALPGMVERGLGAIVNVASMLAFSGTIGKPLPARAVYAATKSFLVTFSQLLAAELEDTGVRVQALCPTVVRTEFHSRQSIDLSDRPQTGPDLIVTASLSALDLGEVVCSPTLPETALLEHLAETERELFAASRETKLAERYQD